MCTFVVVLQSSVSVKVDRETGNAGSVLTVAGFDVQVNYLASFLSPVDSLVLQKGLPTGILKCQLSQIWHFEGTWL